MIRSMTGYGQGSAELAGLKVDVELRTLNNRYADLRFRLPAALSVAEREIRSKILQRVKRGRVELSLNVEQQAGADAQPVLNRPLVQQLLEVCETLQGEFGIKGKLDLNSLLAVSGVLKVEPAEMTWGKDERGVLHRALDAALAALDEDRNREGRSLQHELEQRIGGMKRLAGELRQRAQSIPDALRERLVERLKGLGADVQLDPTRVAQEAVLLADRADVTEEIVRLEAHLAQAQTLLQVDGGEPLGKRLEFLLQEIHRETNTVSSKSSDLELSRTALDLKAETEKVREQVLNLE